MTATWSGVVPGVITSLFDLALDGIQDAPPGRRRRLAVGLELWLGGLLVGGTALVVNDVAALL